MPELPEVETLVRGLRPLLCGRRIVRTWLRHRSLYRRGSLRLNRLVGRRCCVVERVGKNSVFRFEPAGLLVINLGMTGRLLVADGEQDVEGVDRKHLHGRITLDDGREFRFYDARRFGHIYVADTCDFLTDLNVGPDPFIAGADYLRDKLRQRRAPIKALLLDQRILSGIGNIYADETLFYAEVSPRTTGHNVSARAGAILDHARRVLERAIEHGGSTLRDYRHHDGSPGQFQHLHAVYGREGQACTECGVEIHKIVIGGRGTHFCPNCQR